MLERKPAWLPQDVGEYILTRSTQFGTYHPQGIKIISDSRNLQHNFVGESAEPVQEGKQQIPMASSSIELTKPIETLKRDLLQAPTIAFCQFFNPLIFEADDPRTQGLGFELLKLHDNKWLLIQCGSHIISETGAGYAMIELECLVIVRATAKSKVVLACAEFEIEIIIDEKPRVPLLRKCGLDQFEDPRFLRLVMKLQSLQLQCRKCHSLAVTHSRAPIDSPTENDLRMVGIKTGMLAKVKRKLIAIAFLVNFANYFDLHMGMG